LIGGLCGAALAAADNNIPALVWSNVGESWTKNTGLLWKVVIPMVSSPVAGSFIETLWIRHLKHIASL
jgi:PiT family inorganic phosphate transporter